ncbi:MAG: hypothetical protein ACXVC6_10055 [Bacteroidia bacterium]
MTGLPPELSKAAPRDIDYNHELFAKNRKKIKGIFIGSFLIIPLVAVLFWWKFGDVVSGVICGIAITAFCELFAVALMINTKKSVELFKNGTATLGTIESMQIPTDKQGNAYFVMKVAYSDKLGMNYRGNVAMIGKATEVDKKEGDQIAVLYFEDKPQTYAVYSPGMGIVMSRSKSA